MYLLKNLYPEYKEPSKFNNEKLNNLIFLRICKRSEQIHRKQDMQRADMHMHQHHWSSEKYKLEWLKLKTLIIPSVDKDTEKLKLSYSAAGNIK